VPLFARPLFTFVCERCSIQAAIHGMVRNNTQTYCSSMTISMMHLCLQPFTVRWIATSASLTERSALCLSPYTGSQTWGRGMCQGPARAYPNEKASSNAQPATACYGELHQHKTKAATSPPRVSDSLSSPLQDKQPLLPRLLHSSPSSCDKHGEPQPLCCTALPANSSHRRP